MQFTNRIASLIIAGAFPLIFAPQSWAQYYTATDLGSLGNEFGSTAYAINDLGLIVGSSRTAGNVSHAFSESEDVMADLGTLGGSYIDSSAHAVNNFGLIVGYESTNSSSYAFSDIGGVMTDLTVPLGGRESAAFGVNDSGLIVGNFEFSHSSVHAFGFVGGVMTDLGTLAGSNIYANSTAYGVNDSGLIVGGSDTQGNALGGFGEHAFSDIGGVITDLGTLEGSYMYATSRAYAVNNSGLIVGTSTTFGGADAFSDSGGVMTDLDISLPGMGSVAYAVNDSGLIVGSFETASGWNAAFSYLGGVKTDLNLVTSSADTDIQNLVSAYGVNDEGQIVGMAYVDDGEPVAFLLTPTDVAPTQTLSDFNPPPRAPDISNSALLLIFGIALIKVADRRRQKSIVDLSA